jgi:PIN domain nuclease of toxin-antitoxin system
LILLDSHVVVWLACEPARVSRKAHEAIEKARAGDGGLAICDITMLELAVLARKNKIHVTTSLQHFLEELEARFRVLPITAEACACAAALPDSYPSDPADRIIAATAITEDLTLVTADRAIRESGVVRTIW